MNEQKLRALAAKWRKMAMDAVPPEYADRIMYAKYLKLDNRAAGLDEAADELEAALADSGEAPAAGVQLATHLLAVPPPEWNYAEILHRAEVLAAAPPSTERSRALEDNDADLLDAARGLVLDINAALRGPNSSLFEAIEVAKKALGECAARLREKAGS